MKTKIIVSVLLSAALLMISSKGYSQLFSTKLKVTVIDGLGNFTEGAAVTLYTSIDDYRSNQNAVMAGETDEKGRVKFKDLEQIVYFIDVRKDDKNNNGQGVQTGPIEKGKVNKVNIVIE
ncbi:MAG: carboxypeptidase regulatory-like domain-containing protein [Reichenbachiella sp.]|uniref:carboxypeptidase regulatory-like domain-containing protein n=1 Tax=Reichenbachiella sp. TaxID=2184521 RepID=UPI003263961E